MDSADLKILGLPDLLLKKPSVISEVSDRIKLLSMNCNQIIIDDAASIRKQQDLQAVAQKVAQMDKSKEM